MNMSRFSKSVIISLSLLIISINGFAFEQKDFVTDITLAKEMFDKGEHDAAIKYWESKGKTVYIFSNQKLSESIFCFIKCKYKNHGITKNLLFQLQNNNKKIFTFCEPILNNARHEELD